MTWTEERVAELQRLWDTGKSASEIGKILGVSKNSVVGKAHRLKLTARPSPIRRGGTPKPKKKIMPVQINLRCAVEDKPCDIRVCFLQSIDCIVHEVAMLMSCSKQQCFIGAGADDRRLSAGADV